MWFQGWGELQRILVVGLPIYIALVALLRLTGTRSLSKMNAFDAVVTIALGSALATSFMSMDIGGAAALAALFLLIGLQFLIAWLAVRLRIVEKITTSSPKLLLVDGDMLSDEMRRARISTDAVHASIRSKGYGDVAAIAAVVLETDGSLSVIPRQRLGAGDVLRHVDMPQHALARLAE